MSTVNACESLPALPAASVARTTSVWAPSTSAAAVNGAPHGANVAVSTLHSTVVGLPLVVKSKLGVLSPVSPDGPLVIVTVGAVRSTVQVCSAGVGSGVPAIVVTRTAKVCAPSARPL